MQFGRKRAIFFHEGTQRPESAETAAGTSFEGDPEEALVGFCRYANRRICQYADRNNISSMGTTAAVLLFRPDGIRVCNVGDSRIYLDSGKKLTQLSEDHGIPMEGRKKPPLSQNLGIPEDELLIGASDLRLAELVKIIRERGGVPVPAHINRGSNGLLVNLGFMPEELSFTAVEVWRGLPCPHTPQAGKVVLHSSDAHQLGDILEPEIKTALPELSAGAFLDMLRAGATR